MARYIDADALMDWIIEADPDWCVNPVRNIFDHIEELPPADVAEVVRCKDCVHGFASGRCVKQLFVQESDGFCSRGERKEGGANADT